MLVTMVWQRLSAVDVHMFVVMLVVMLVDMFMFVSFELGIDRTTNNQIEASTNAIVPIRDRRIIANDFRVGGAQRLNKREY